MERRDVMASENRSWFGRSITKWPRRSTRVGATKRDSLVHCKQIRGGDPMGSFSLRSRNDTYVIGNAGAGEGIRTLDPDLGKVVLYP
jgi:hypothetical protein